VRNCRIPNALPPAESPGISVGARSRRGFLFGMAAAAAGCARREPPGEAGSRLALLVPASERQVWSVVAASFEAQRPRTRVRLVEGPNSTDLRENLYTASLLAEDDSFDLVLMDVTWTAKFAAAGWLRRLDEAFGAEEQARFLPQALEAGRYDGSLYRVPTRTDVGVLYFRRDWLEQAGIEAPRTFEELARASRALQAPPERWGFVWPGSQYEGLVCFFLEVLHGHGGFWVDAQTLDVGLDRPEGLAALEFLRRSRLEQPISPPGVTTYKEEESRRLFQDGRAVFLRNWPYAWRLAQAEGSPLAGRVGAQAMVSLSAEPGAGTLGGWGLGVSRHSRRPDEALAFIRHATSLAGQRALCRTSGYAPARVEAWEDPALLAANPFLATLRPIHAAAVARPPLPRYALVSDILQRRLSAALAGLTSTAEALGGAARETRRVLQGARA
jgi:multiple sugar transport system substrate-binding protein